MDDSNKSTGKNLSFQEKIRNNPWPVASVVLGILVVVLLVLMMFQGGLTGNVIKESDAADNLLKFVEDKGIDAELVSTYDMGSLYEITLLIQGEEQRLYVTKDGALLVEPRAELNQQTQGEEDWSVFETSLPSALKAEILGFVNSEPEATSNQRVWEFKDYEECEKSLIVFYYEGCGWCNEYYPVLVQAQVDYPDLKIYAFDLGSNGDIAGKYYVSGTPSSIINCKYFVSGYMDKENLYSVLDSFS